MSNKLQNNYAKICRICLQEENLKSFNENVKLIEMMKICLSFQIDKNDGLPDKICINCIKELEQFYRFAKKFQNTDATFIKSNRIKEPKPLPVSLIENVDPDMNAEEFVLPDKTVTKTGIGNKNDFILIDRNIIRKIKNYNEKSNVPSPSYELKKQKLKILNSQVESYENIASSVEPEILKQDNKITTNDAKSKITNKENGTTPLKENIENVIRSNYKNITNLNFQSLSKEKLKSTEVIKENTIKSPVKKNITPVPQTQNKNIDTNLNKVPSLESSKENQKSNEYSNESKIPKEKETKLNSNKIKSNWRTRKNNNKNHRNKKHKKKVKKVLPYSSEKFHAQFLDFLSSAKNTEKDKDEKMEDEELNNEVKNDKKVEQNISINKEPKSNTSQSKSIDNSKTVQIKNKLVTGYVRRFQNMKECPICRKTFKYLEPHLRIHSHKKLATLKQETEVIEEPKFKCGFCDRVFLYKSTLVHHQSSHLKDKPFTCTICKKSFREMNSLQRHLNMHTKHDLYKCEICNKRSYNIKSNLYRHQRVCSVKFNAKRGL